MCVKKEARDNEEDKKVTAGLVRRVFDAYDFRDHIEEVEDLLHKYITIVALLERREYQDDDQEVSIGIRDHFQELISSMNTRFGTFLPKSKDELE